MSQGTKQRADGDSKQDLKPCLHGVLGKRSVSIAKRRVGNEEWWNDEKVIVGDGSGEESGNESQ